MPVLSRSFSLLGWLFCVLAFAGCAADATSRETGGATIQLALADGTQIAEVTYVVSGNAMPDMSGAIDTSAPGSTASIEIYGIPSGREYLITMAAAAADGETTCSGSAFFDVGVGQVTNVMVILNCELPRALGGVRVNGKLNICAALAKVVVSPLQTSVGNEIDVFAHASDVEGDEIEYEWTASSGLFANPSAPITTYSCEEAGDHTFAVTVSDDDFAHCEQGWAVEIACVDDDGAGGSGGAGGEGGTGGAPACDGHDDCNDRECTDGTCTDGVCEYVRANDGALCDAGTCESGECRPITSIFACTEEGINDAIAAGGGPHAFACNGPTTLVTEAEIVIDNDVILDGLDELTVHGNNDHRLFTVSAGVTATLRRFSVTRGATTEAGGGVFSEGALTMNACIVTLNVAQTGGGGIFNDQGDVTLVDSLVMGNTTVLGDGGGVRSVGTGTSIVNGTTISGNVANASGGGIYAGPLIRFTPGAHMVITGSVVSGNTANGGGGIYLAGRVSSGDGTLAVTDSTVSDNSATSGGGGIVSLHAQASVVRTTVSGNVSGLGGGGIQSFGGAASELLVDSSTISGNSATNAGGAIFAPDGVLILTHSTVSQNDTPDNAAFADIQVAPFPGLMVARSLIEGDCGAQNVTSDGYNIESPGDTCKLTELSDQSMVTPRELALGPLADNGGPTETHILLPGSVAIDLIPEAECLDPRGEPLTTDQRGEPRPGGATCDVGAFEVQP